MFMDFLADLPQVPYPYNHAMSPTMQRLHWVMTRLPLTDRPTLVPMIRKLGHRDVEGMDFVLSVPTADAGHELAYYCKDITPGCRQAFQAVQQSDSF